MILPRRAFRATGIFATGLLCGATAAWLSRPHMSPKEETEPGSRRVVSFLEGTGGDGGRVGSVGASREEFARILEEIRRYPFGEIDPRLYELSRRWSAESPADAFRGFLDARELSDRHYFFVLNRAMAAWGKVDPEAALAAAEAVGDKSLRQELVVSALLESNPEDAIKRLEAMGAPLRPDLYARIFSDWGARDGAAAQMGFATLENSKLRSEAALVLAAALAENDLAGALQWAGSLENGGERTEALVRIIQTAAGEDPAAAAEGLHMLEEGPRKDFAYRSVIEAWARRDPQAALAWVRDETTEEGFGREAALSTLAYSLVTVDSGLAASLMEEIPAGPGRVMLAARFAEEWTDFDPRAAFDWGEGLQGEERDRVLARVASYWSMRDPTAAGDFVTNLPDDPAYQSFRLDVVRRWVEADPQQAIAWAASLEGPEGRSIHQAAASSWTKGGDPKGAAQHVEGIEDPALRYRNPPASAG